MNRRLRKIFAKLENLGLDGLILSSPANISYLVGFKSCQAYLLISPAKNIYFTDARYIEEVKRQLKNCFLEEVNGSVFTLIAQCVKKLKLRRIGFEERHLSFAEYKKIKTGSGKDSRLVGVSDIVEELRQLKDEDEIRKLKRATQIAIQSLEFIQRFISPGRREIEVAAELERFIRYAGGAASAFEIIVASGPNSSYPHHQTSPRKIRDNEPVLVDIGVEYWGYKSDLTRVFFTGKIKMLFRKIYQIVLQAQEIALKKIKPAVGSKEIDAAAREYITRRGYSGFFNHSLGHGLGLEVHEAPYLSQKENVSLKPAMVFTVEPAIYLPGKFGVRIEDIVLVTEKGGEVLSGALHK